MAIDFTSITKLIPANGSLSLSFQDLGNGMLRVTVAPKFSEKDMPKYPKGENAADVTKAISPITFEDTVANFQKEFVPQVTELIALKGNLLQATVEACKTLSSTSAKKKEDLKKSIDNKQAAIKKGTTPAAGKTEGKEKTGEKPAQTPASPGLDLFSTPPAAAASTTTAPVAAPQEPAVAPEACSTEERTGEGEEPSDLEEGAEGQPETAETEAAA